MSKIRSEWQKIEARPSSVPTRFRDAFMGSVDAQNPSLIGNVGVKVLYPLLAHGTDSTCFFITAVVPYLDMVGRCCDSRAKCGDR